MKLNELSPALGAKKLRKRVGRGNGSGCGNYSGRGNKGFNARSGGGVRPGYEGGQMPIHRRLPKRGFTNIFKKRYAIINISDLQKFQDKERVEDKDFIEAGILKGKIDGVKLLGKGEINFPLQIKVSKCSKTAKAKIEAAGGEIEGI